MHRTKRQRWLLLSIPQHGAQRGCDNIVSQKKAVRMPPDWRLRKAVALAVTLVFRQREDIASVSAASRHRDRYDLV